MVEAQAEILFPEGIHAFGFECPHCHRLHSVFFVPENKNIICGGCAKEFDYTKQYAIAENATSTDSSGFVFGTFGGTTQQIFRSSNRGIIMPRDSFQRTGISTSDLLALWEADQPFAAAAIPAPLQTGQPYPLRIENPTDEIKNVVLFGANNYLFQQNSVANFGSDEGVTVQNIAVPDNGYVRLLAQTSNKPERIAMIRLNCEREVQLSEIISITFRDANGRMCQDIIDAALYQNAWDEIRTIIQIPYLLLLDGNTEVSFRIHPQTELTMQFFPAR